MISDDDCQLDKRVDPDCPHRGERNCFLLFGKRLAAVAAGAAGIN